MINWNIDDYGILRVYEDNKILFEISGCNNMGEKEIEKLIKEELESESE